MVAVMVPPVSTPSFPAPSQGWAHRNERAKQLLLSYLSEHQRFTYLKFGFFYVLGKNGQIYALEDGYCICEVNRRTGRIPAKWGYHLENLHRYPLADRLLAQMLLISSRSYRRAGCPLRPDWVYHRRPPIHPKLRNGSYLPSFLSQVEVEDQPRRRSWPQVGGLWGAR